MKRKKAVVALLLAASLVVPGMIALAEGDDGPPAPVEITKNKIEFEAKAPEEVELLEPEEGESEIEEEEGIEVIKKPQGLLRIEAVPKFDFGKQNVNEKLWQVREYEAILPMAWPLLENGDRDPAYDEPVDVPSFVQVGDWRATGAGWTLNVAFTEQFTSLDVIPALEEKATLENALLILKNVAVVSDKLAEDPSVLRTSDARLAVSDSEGSNATGLVAALGDGKEGMYRTVVKFGDNAAEGKDSIILEIPANTVIYDAIYHGTVRWTLSDVPPETKELNSGAHQEKPPAEQI